MRGAERGVGSGGDPGDAALIGGDQRQRRRERHLEARMHHRLRRQQHDRERRHRDGAQRQRRPVRHDADQHHRCHDEGALRRHLGAGQHEVAGGGDERGGRRPFLDRDGAARGRDQRQQRPQDEEHHAGDQRHVIAGDRQHMADAGNEHGVEHAAVSASRLPVMSAEAIEPASPGIAARMRRSMASRICFDRGREPQAPARRSRRPPPA